MILISDLLPALKTRMANRIQEEYEDEFLMGELENALYKVSERRFCEPEELENKYTNSIIEIALYNISLIGGDFQTQHSENGVQRVFVKEEEILKKIIPKARSW